MLLLMLDTIKDAHVKNRDVRRNIVNVIKLWCHAQTYVNVLSAKMLAISLERRQVATQLYQITHKMRRYKNRYLQQI